jgi:hypothetical protein
MLEERVRDLEDKMFRFNVEKETMLLVIMYLFDKLMAPNNI